jgi:Kef-type K+ transport system membrane component KefB/Trk K+ transport system NAD-binding subunit
MEEHLDFAPLLIVLVLAFAVPLFLARLRWLPVVVGEILAGVVIGTSGFGLVHQDPMLEIFSNIGLSFLMFLAGLEIDFDKLFPAPKRGQRHTPQGNKILPLSAGVYALTLALAVPAGFALNAIGLEGNPWLLAFILSATSLGVLLPVLKQREMSGTKTGQAIFYTAMLADFITVVLLTIFIIFLNKGFDLEVFSVGLLFLAFFIFYRLAGGFFRIQQIRTIIEELSHVTVQIKVRGAIAILMAFVVLAGALGLELILGAFLAGMIISLLKRPEDSDLVNKLEAFGFGFFIPVFFIAVGADLNLRALIDSPQSLLLLPVLFIIALGVKTIPSLLFVKEIGWRNTLASAMLLNTHLSLEIAVAVIGVRLGLLTPSANVAIILFAILTVLVMPILFNSILPQAPGKEKKHMVLFGANDLGLKVARTLAGHGERVHFIESDPAQVDQARKAGFNVIQAATVEDCLWAACEEVVQALLVLLPDDDRNLEICHQAVHMGIGHIVSLVNNPARLTEFRRLGVHAFAPTLYRPTLLAMLARSPDMMRLLTDTTDQQDVRELHLRNPSGQLRRLNNLGLPGNLLVLSIGRNGEIIIPHGNTQVELGDRLTILGNIEDLLEAERWLESTLPV